MSVNYYIHTTDADLAFDLLPNVNMIKEKKCFSEQRYFSIHIAQTMGIHKPDFEVHGDLKNWNLLREFLEKNKERYTIHDEYDRPVYLSNFIEQIEKLMEIGKIRPADLGTREWWYDYNNCRFLNFEFS